MSLTLVLVGIVLAASSGGVAALLHRSPRAAQRAATALMLAAAAAGIAGAVAVLAGVPAAEIHRPWSAPGAALALRLDALSAIFLLPIFAIPALGSVYGNAYYAQSVKRGRALHVEIFYGLITAAMALLVVAANAMLFLAAWEVMALCGFLLVLTEHEKKAVQDAGFVFVAAAHVGTLALFAFFAWTGHAAGSFDFARIEQARLTPGPLLFFLMVAGFGMKVGLMPLHFWLPGAHASAPSHVSALLSGVMLKTGIYGILRMSGLCAAPPLWWGLSILGVGAASAVLGVAFALAQHDLKRLLAYHSVENVGIIAMGVGLALVGRALGDPTLVLLGFAGGVLHVVNHSLFKALLFLGAGAVDHACGTREIDRLGGLARAMPRTALLFLVGSAAISGLPPLNGFVSEWFVYLASLRVWSSGGPHAAWAALAAPALALVGGLAAACFAKVHGTVFLGSPRSESALKVHEPPRAMLLPMAALALACAVIGLLPTAMLPALRRGAAAWAHLAPEALGQPSAHAMSALTFISVAAAALILLAGGIAAWRRPRARGPETETWGCGFTAPTPRMQYTGSSFAEMLTLRFGWAFFPHARVVPPRGPFPRQASFSSHVPDTVLDVALAWAVERTSRTAAQVRRRVHRGEVQGQALLVVLALLALFAWRFIWW